VLNELWWRAMPISVSCLLHVGLVTGLIVGQHWLATVGAHRPPVLHLHAGRHCVPEPPQRHDDRRLRRRRGG